MNRNPLFVALLATLVTVGAGACSFKMPRVHKVTVQQGNLVTQEMVDRLKPGMSRSQVAFIMGEPVLRNPFNTDRWDYLYSVEIPGQYEDTKTISLYFDGDQLLYFTGDYAPSATQETVPETAGEVAPPETPSISTAP